MMSWAFFIWGCLIAAVGVAAMIGSYDIARNEKDKARIEAHIKELQEKR